jgi:hypothetical protein
VSSVSFWWNALGLCLLFVWLLQCALRGWKGTVVAAALAAFVSFIPFFGHVPRYWLSGLTPNISVPLFVLLALSIMERAGCRPAFRRRDWHAALLFGAVASLLLYPSALGLGLPGLDTYSLGWPWLEWGYSLTLFGVVASVATLLVWLGNRFGWILLATALLYLLGVQESRNFWDYLIDPFYAVVSFFWVAKSAVNRLRRR